MDRLQWLWDWKHCWDSANLMRGLQLLLKILLIILSCFKEVFKMGQSN